MSFPSFIFHHHHHRLLIFRVFIDVGCTSFPHFFVCICFIFSRKKQLLYDHLSIKNFFFFVLLSMSCLSLSLSLCFSHLIVLLAFYFLSFVPPLSLFLYFSFPPFIIVIIINLLFSPEPVRKLLFGGMRCAGTGVTEQQKKLYRKHTTTQKLAGLVI